VRVLEFFCGIGGCAAALPPHASVVAAIDIYDRALGVYAANFPFPTYVRDIESLGERDYRRWQADLWWMSPPCQPYTLRGKQRDDQDPRARSLLALLEWIDRYRPPYVALENVPPFGTSRMWSRMQWVLERAGYCVATQEVCPTELGIPSRRRRFYMLAARNHSITLSPPEGTPHVLAEYLLGPDEEDVWVPAGLLARYRHAIHILDDPTDPQAVVSCFTAAYGNSPVRSGSCLRSSEGVRRFTPREVARLMGFPDSFRLPDFCSRRQLWNMLGNSLSVPVVTWLLRHIPELSDKTSPPHSNNN
jgi:site-specific DNA-cytosine methylase